MLEDSKRGHRDALAFIGKARRDESGMQAVGGDPRALELSRQFASEKNIVELRLAVGLEAAEAPRELKIAEVDRCAAMRVGSCADDAGSRRRENPLAEHVRQDEI